MSLTDEETVLLTRALKWYMKKPLSPFNCCEWIELEEILDKFLVHVAKLQTAQNEAKK